MDNSQAKRDSRQVNPGGNNNDPMTLTAGELADIKEVVGRLYKKITELEVNQKSDREKDRAELAAWAQTNLIQTQLLGKQTAVIEILTTELKHSARLSQQSDPHNESLLTELLNLNNLLGSMPKSSPNVENLELKGLKSEVVALRSALTAIPQKLERVNQGQMTLETQQLRMDTKLLSIENQTDTRLQNQSGIAGWNSRDWWWFGGKLVVVLLGLWLIVDNTNSIKSKLAETWDRAGWSNTKLERIEKKLRIRSNS
jgi:hypothetical protein